jgi:hypothetical protein
LNMQDCLRTPVASVRRGGGDGGAQGQVSTAGHVRTRGTEEREREREREERVGKRVRGVLLHAPWPPNLGLSMQLMQRPASREAGGVNLASDARRQRRQAAARQRRSGPAWAPERAFPKRTPAGLPECAARRRARAAGERTAVVTDARLAHAALRRAPLLGRRLLHHRARARKGGWEAGGRSCVARTRRPSQLKLDRPSSKLALSGAAKRRQER